MGVGVLTHGQAATKKLQSPMRSPRLRRNLLRSRRRGEIDKLFGKALAARVGGGVLGVSEIKVNEIGTESKSVG